MGRKGYIVCYYAESHSWPGWSSATICAIIQYIDGTLFKEFIHPEDYSDLLRNVFIPFEHLGYTVKDGAYKILKKKKVLK